MTAFPVHAGDATGGRFILQRKFKDKGQSHDRAHRVRELDLTHWHRRKCCGA
jgi:hypothetical protein